MSDSNNCLSEAVACSLFFKEEKTRCLMNVTSCCMNKCTATEYCTECEKAGKTEFEKKKSKPETWTHYFNPAGLCTPSSISDVHKLEVRLKIFYSESEYYAMNAQKLKQSFATLLCFTFKICIVTFSQFYI